MEISKNLLGSVAYVTNMPVYDASTLQNGELMMWNPSAHSAGVPNSGDVNYLVTAAAVDATEAVDAVGATQCSSTSAVGDKINLAFNAQSYQIGTDFLANAASTAGFNFLPVCISPHVLYMAEWYQVADSDGGANVGNCTTASTSTTVTLTSRPDHEEAGFMFTTAATDSTAPNGGQLRYITVGGAGSFTIDSAATITTSDDLIIMSPPLYTRLALTDDGVGLRGGLTDKTADDFTIALGTSLQLLDNYGGWEGAPQHRLRYWVDKGLNGIARSRFFGEIFCTDHLWATKPA